MAAFPPRPKRSPGDTFIDFIKRNFVPKVVLDYIENANIRVRFVGANLEFILEHGNVGSVILGWFISGFAFIVYGIFGIGSQNFWQQVFFAVLRGPERWVAFLGSQLKRVLEINIFDPLAEAIIQALFSTAINRLIDDLPRQRGDPSALGLKFAQTLGIASLRFSLFTATLSLFMPGPAARIAQSIAGLYWSLGLGFLGWQALAPVASHAIQKPQENFLNYNFPKEIPSASVIADLFSSRMLSYGEAVELLQQHGIRPEFHKRLLERAFSRISVSDLFDLYRAGKIDVSMLASYLAIHGYKDEDIPLIIAANTLPKEESIPNISLSVLRQALREGIITEDQFRQKAREIPRNPEEIELIILIERMRKAVEKRMLTVSQIREAFKAGVLREPEVVHYLQELGLEDTAINILLNTWKEELKPRFVFLNASRLAEAYTYGVIDENTFFHKLLLLGWDEESANIFIKTVKARLAEREDRPSTERVRKPTTSQVLTFMVQGIISQDEAFNLLKELGYDDTTASRLIKSALIEPPKQPRKLSKAEIVELWKKGFIVTDTAIERLTLLDYAREEAEAILFMEGPALGESDLVKAWRAGIIPTDKFVDAAVKVGYRKQDVIRLVRWLENPIEHTEVVQAFREGLITAEEARRALLNLGYSPDQINAVIPVA